MSITKEGLLPPPMKVGGLIMIEEEAEVEVGEVIMHLEDVVMVMVMDMGMGPEVNQIRIMLIKASPDTAMDTGLNMGTAVIEEEGGVGVGAGEEEEEEVEGGEDHIDDFDDNTLTTIFLYMIHTYIRT